MFKALRNYALRMLGAIGNLEKDYVLGTDRTVRVKRYVRGANAYLRTELEAAGITVTGSYSPPNGIGGCWVEFNLNEITEYKKL
ncbi:hypothetical protein [Treponema endosymbiont of Eucomonympha sp.]|uniref:hypothetical protein n=1 Tax=Treponema endosymbiont of Eucomonympha sp. TaxID=1580831 RepID=UPI001396CEC8|nr:hypothetical protein [Treponema endosymbiont of Eucomonympha sp.]